ncbi:hypothetical protein D3C81_1830080 [compost metagenome]
MKFLNNVKEKITSLGTTGKVAIIGTTVLTGLTQTAHAETTLDPAITGGFTQAGATGALIVAAGVAACVGVIAASGGAKAGLKWIKGVFAKAS